MDLLRGQRYDCSRRHHLPLQNEADASRVKISEMQSQQDGFDNQMAKAALAASEKRIILDNRMVQAELEVGSGWTSYDMHACGYVEPVARVSLTSSIPGGIRGGCIWL